ncbi:hypothetical protein VNO78_28519 [Psophocarpus tetragonolobus]|uniref:Glycosyltransferase n=1 Tax=Psophocarpus tetragonolobus TaxID=3891 RepID=A0AAN9S1K1_PSOTE
MVQQRFLLITYPIQGHINPSIQFAKRVAAMGVHVTFATSVFVQRRMLNKPTIPGLSFATFSDGFDDGYKTTEDSDIVSYMSELERRGSESLRNMIIAAKNEGEPFTCLAYTILLPWAAKVAREFHIPGALLWIQAATVFDIYYYYFHNYFNMAHKSSIELPGLPFCLTRRDIPSFLLPSNIYNFALPSLQQQFEDLDEESKPNVIVNTFEGLEPEALRGIDKFRMIPIGPLIPSAFLDEKDPSDTSFGGDIVDVNVNVDVDASVEWLDSQAESCVVYVSFGTLAVLGERQMEEVARALLDSGYPFLWVIRDSYGKQEQEQEQELSCREELEQRGKIVKWCSQVEVLSHGSVGCFVTHCGWNSTLESLASGVPMVAFPQWSDQGTNAKMVEDVWRTGVRVDDKVNEEGIVEAREITKCLHLLMAGSEKGQEFRRNAHKWKCLAREAVKEGGSSHSNLTTFLFHLSNFQHT